MSIEIQIKCILLFFYSRLWLIFTKQKYKMKFEREEIRANKT